MSGCPRIIQASMLICRHTYHFDKLLVLEDVFDKVHSKLYKIQYTFMGSEVWYP